MSNNDPAGFLEQVSNIVVSATAVQLPTFMKDDPEAWFGAVESHFVLKNVTDPKTKYHHAVAKLDAETTSAVREVLRAPTTNQSYQELRDLLCDLFEAPPEQRLDELFSLTTMGDSKPTRFARELDRLADGQTMTDVKTRIFLHCLPPSIQTAIGGNVSKTYTDLVKAAEKAWARADESSRASVNRVDDFAVAAVSSQGSGRGRGRGGHRTTTSFYGTGTSAPSSAGTRTPQTARPAQSGLCRYHRRWGDSARSCTEWCSRWTERRRAPNHPQVFSVEEEQDPGNV